MADETGEAVARALRAATEINRTIATVLAENVHSVRHGAAILGQIQAGRKVRGVELSDVRRAFYEVADLLDATARQARDLQATLDEATDTAE